MLTPAPYDLAPTLALLAIGALFALAPFAWALRRARGQGPAARRHALTLLTLFLTFDLVLFGAFTRLTDSGLGCPDWPGCYASASPLGAHAEIHAAQSALPEGPVTHRKAWIEMTHRYLASGVGALIVVLAALNWGAARRGEAGAAPWWAAATLAWVCLQGAFGALTVTMKLYPAIVTAHLLGGLVLLALLAARHARREGSAPLSLPPRLYAGVLALALASVVQIALGGWVSTNYAVLACREFPMCQGAWWPPMDFASGFALRRDLGTGADGGALPFAALTAIHMAHRFGAYVVLAGMALFAWALRAGGDAARRRFAGGVAAIALWQLASGLSNVVLGWPLLGALAHTAGAAAWVLLLTTLLVRARRARPARASQGLASRALRAAP
ncbi:MAG TPA: COX15/CtaA family protein [Burkholderiaceae bacterium]|nr:COX15/CtaA family protein [Burkholderiaceae bacterium]